MKIPFVKYHGAGNDFILIDDRVEGLGNLTNKHIKQMCDRHYGIGADGLIFIRNIYSVDFKMVYHNADGKEGSLCGNGARCAVIFAAECGVLFNTHSFMAYDGIHQFLVTDHNRVKVSMRDVKMILQRENALLLDTGSPHIVFNVDDVEALNVYETGKQIRYNHEFTDKGVNVNFLQILPDALRLRTYERGVENETEACGTGCVAAAISRSEWSKNSATEQSYQVIANGGRLTVNFHKEGNGIYNNIFLEGPVERVYEGVYKI